MKTNKIVYWIATGLMTLVFLFLQECIYLIMRELQVFLRISGFPTWIIYPLAIAKILGLVAVLSRKVVL